MDTRNFLLSGFVALALSACGSSNEKHMASGSFEAVEITVSCEIPGRITELNISEGDHVKAAQSVGHIDTVQLYLQKMSLVASNKGISVQRPDIAAQTAPLKEQLAQLETDKIRIENLVKNNVANKKQLDDLNARMKIIQSQITATESSLSKSYAHITAGSSAAEIQVEQINDRLRKCNIVSPINGIILSKYHHAGEVVGAGMPLFKVANLDTLVFRAYVTGEQLSQCKLNDRVKVSADYGEEMKSYDGRLIWVSDKAEFTPKTIQTQNERSNLVYAIKIEVPNDGYLKIGMYGEVNLHP